MKKIQTMIPMLLGLTFLVVIIIIFVLTKSAQNNVLSEQVAEINMLEMKANALQNSISEQRADILVDMTGLDESRISHDNAVVGKLLDLVCTWDSYEEYNTARDTVMRRYGLSEDDDFMTSFMPKITEQVTSSGEHYNRIDYLGLNMTYEYINSMVTRISATNYYYFAVVTVSSSWTNGGEAMSKIAMTYGVDVDGNLFDIYAIPIA